MQKTQNRRKIQLSDHFTYSRLIRFTLPSIIIMIFSSLYGVVDGYFISNIVGKTAFASVNLIIPFVQIISGLGVLLGADGGSLISRTLGTGNREKAGRYFTMTMAALLFGGILFNLVFDKAKVALQAAVTQEAEEKATAAETEADSEVVLTVEENSEEALPSDVE